MAMRLSALFGCPLGELFRKMSPQEFALWVAFYKLEPWGYNADNYHAALVAATVANHSGLHTEPFAPRAFMDSAGEEKPHSRVEDEIARTMEILA